ncbi:hypothetical protein L1047_12795 [Synechococcus sp. Nb3U1]|uniref:hypothetical protein n=1 Tax=Synechococcus sp. Nb3U1 TaxID=1914529 RepID=UPI001F379655|nr:hypothetical protein [Synechococcus sp. Nb3U1]MCF2972074.1 hypothetical protein [Synechococcus sp. Nb3U1]
MNALIGSPVVALSWSGSAPAGLLSVSGLRKQLPVGGGNHLYAVDHLNFAMDAGESVGLVGRQIHIDPADQPSPGSE